MKKTEQQNLFYKVFNVQEDQNEDFYKIVKNWWEKIGWIAYPKDALSTTGIMICDKDRPICAAWIYQTDSSTGLIGHVITEKEIKAKLKKEAVKFLFKALEQEASKLAIKMLFFMITTNSLAKIAENELGYISTKQKCNELVKFI